MEANAAAIRAELPADLVFANHVLPGGAVAAAAGAPFAVKAHGSELEFSIRGRPVLVERGRGSARRRAGGVRRLRPHPRRAGGRARTTSTACTRCRRASTWTSSGPRAATRRSRTWSPRPAATRRTRATRPSACPDEGNPGGSRSSSRRDEPTVVYFGKLMPTKGVDLLLEALREVGARARDRRLRRVARASSRRRRRPGRSSPARSSTGTWSTCCRCATSPSCRRSSPRRSAWSRRRRPPPAARRSWRGTPASPRSPPGSRRSTGRSGRRWRASARATPPTSPPSSVPCSRSPRSERRELGAAARRTVVERWSWESVAERLLAPLRLN